MNGVTPEVLSKFARSPRYMASVSCNYLLPLSRRGTEAMVALANKMAIHINPIGLIPVLTRMLSKNMDSKMIVKAMA